MKIYIYIALMAICGLFLFVGCHNDSDDYADGYTVTTQWKSDDVYTATITYIENGEASFRIDETLLRELPTWAGYYMGTPDKWFYTSDWPYELHVGFSIKFRVEKIEYFESTKYMHAPEPSHIHFYIKPAETE